MARFAAANPLSDDTGILKQALTRLIQLLDTGYVVESTLNGVTYRISITAKEGIVITADGTEVMWIDTATGNIRFSGDITGSSGTFSGTISGGSIYIPNSTTPVFSVNSSGTMNASSGTFGGQIAGGSISIPATSPNFYVDSDGKTTVRGVLNVYDGLNVYNGDAYFDDDIYVDASIEVDNNIYPSGNNASYCGTDALPWQEVWARVVHAKDDMYADNYYPNSSDRRLKKDIEPIKHGVELVLNIDPVQYKLIDGESGRTHYGFIAQQAKEAMTKVGIEDCALYADRSLKINPQTGKPDNEFLTLSYIELIAPMVQTIQHLEQRIKDLEARLEPSV